MHNRGAYLIGLWCTPVAIVALFAGMALLGGFIPPPSPTLSPAETAAMYIANPTGIKLTGLLTIITPALLAPLTAIISVMLWRGEGRNAPMALTQVVAGVLTIGPFILTGLCWAVAAYRPDRSPDSIVLLNDMAWVSLEMVTAPAIVELFAVAIAILYDRSPNPVFPRWIAFFSFWVSLSFLPGMMVPMFFEGPFAWNGILSFWVAASTYGAWLLVMFVMCLRALRVAE